MDIIKKIQGQMNEGARRDQRAAEAEAQRMQHANDTQRPIDRTDALRKTRQTSRIVSSKS